MMIPAIAGILLVLSGALPSIVGGHDIFPHMAVLLCCYWVMHYPAALPLWFVFFLGLLQDVLAGTALGAQAVLLMLTCVVLACHARHVNRQNFRMVWIEVAVVSALYLVALWLLMSWVSRDWLPLLPVAKELFFTVLFYPLLHLLLSLLAALLPPIR